MGPGGSLLSPTPQSPMYADNMCPPHWDARTALAWVPGTVGAQGHPSVPANPSPPGVPSVCRVQPIPMLCTDVVLRASVQDQLDAQHMRVCRCVFLNSCAQSLPLSWETPWGAAGIPQLSKSLGYQLPAGVLDPEGVVGYLLGMCSRV